MAFASPLVSQIQHFYFGIVIFVTTYLQLPRSLFQEQFLFIFVLFSCIMAGTNNPVSASWWPCFFLLLFLVSWGFFKGFAGKRKQGTFKKCIVHLGHSSFTFEKFLALNWVLRRDKMNKQTNKTKRSSRCSGKDWDLAKIRVSGGLKTCSTPVLVKLKLLPEMRHLEGYGGVFLPLSREAKFKGSGTTFTQQAYKCQGLALVSATWTVQKIRLHF